MMLGRRELAAIAGAMMLGGRSSWAQRSGAVRAPAVPCPSQSGDIVAVMLRGPAAGGSVAVFGQVFRRGDVPRDATLLARPAGGARALPVQLDVKTRHGDGSVRHAVVSLAAPALRAGEWTSVMLARGNAEPARPIDLAAALNGRGAMLEIAPSSGGAPWRVDLVKLAQTQAASPAAGAMWQDGALASQIRIALPVPSEAVGSAATPRLIADLAVRFDGTLWVAVWIRNDLAMQRSGGAAEYALRLTLDGREALRTEPFRQAQYQGFGRTRAVGRGGAAAPVIGVHHDVVYLADTGAVPNFDIAAGVDERLLGRMAQGMSAPAWDTPLSPRGFTQYMGTTGGRGDIGTVTLWQAAWLISADPRAAAYAMGQAEAGGGIPWHFWDPGRNGWLTLTDHPKLWADQRGNPTLTQPVPRDTGWTPELAHHPASSAVPYILTGERWLLDNLQGQAAGVILSAYPASRQDGRGLVANRGQVRAQAWTLRDIDNAAWLSPDGTPEAAYFRKIADNNWSFLASSISDWTSRQGAPHGWIPGTNRDPGLIAPWQQDYFAMTSAIAVMRGNEHAVSFLRWQSNFLIGRFVNEGNGFRPTLGVAYQLAVSDSRSQQPLQGTAFPTWAEIDRQSEERRLLPSKPWGSVGYNALALATLAGLYNSLGLQQAADLFSALSRQMLGTSLADYQRTPTFAIVPRGYSRAGHRAPTCGPGSR